MATGNRITVFTKPWAAKGLESLADFIREIGLDGVELPVRPGYQVTPETVGAGLPRAAKVFRDRGLQITSIAASADKTMIAAAGEAGVPIIRIMANIDMNKGYRASVDGYRRLFDTLLPDLERHGVTIGVQNHCDYFVGSAVGLMELLRGYDPRRVGAVLDPAHCALDGEPEDMAVDIAWSGLVLVNLKNAYWQRLTTAGQESEWRKYWSTGRTGLCSWSAVLASLSKRGWKGAYCLSAEYTGLEGPGDLKEDDAIPHLRDDIAYLKSLLA